MVKNGCCDFIIWADDRTVLCRDESLRGVLNKRGEKSTRLSKANAPDQKEEREKAKVISSTCRTVSIGTNELQASNVRSLFESG